MLAALVRARVGHVCGRRVGFSYSSFHLFNSSVVPLLLLLLLRTSTRILYRARIDTFLNAYTHLPVLGMGNNERTFISIWGYQNRNLMLIELTWELRALCR